MSIVPGASAAKAIRWLRVNTIVARGPPSSLARPRARPAKDLVKAIRIWKNATQATVVLSLPSRSLGGGPSRIRFFFHFIVLFSRMRLFFCETNFAPPNASAFLAS